MDCDDLGSIIRYDFKLKNGKKPKKGLLNGSGTLIFPDGIDGNENYNFGFRNKKCINIYMKNVRKLSGNFVNDTIEVNLTFSFFKEYFNFRE